MERARTVGKGDASMKDSAKESREQVVYANLLFYGSWISILLMGITYLIYITGLLDPYVPLQEVIRYWSGPSSQYVHDARVPVGWGWASLLAKGDFLNFIGIALLAGMTLICFLTLIPAYLKKKDLAFLAITVVEILVLCLAASGILGTGGH